MKRASLISVLLTVALAIACSTPTIGPGTANPGLITIAIVVAQDPHQTGADPTVEVTYPSYAASPQKIRWCVYNDTNSKLTKVSIDFPNGSPCDNNPNLTLYDIDPGNDPAACTEVCGCVSTAKQYPYKVDVTTASGGHGINADPRVILN